MPVYYDTTYSATSGTTSLTQLWAQTVANQETANITALYISTQGSGTVGGGVMTLKTNTGTTASSGTVMSGVPRNMRASVSALTLWWNAGSAISSGTAATARIQVGFAQTGGQNGWVAIEPDAALQMQPNLTNPKDVEIASITTSASQTTPIQVEFYEGR